MPENNFLVFVGQHPECYEASQSKLLVSLLETVSKQSKNCEQIQEEIPLNLSKLQEIVDSLVEVKLLEKMFAANKHFFSLTEKGKKFLELYREQEKKTRIN